MALDMFGKLEDRLDKLLENFEMLQKENKGLRASTELKDRAIEELKERIKKLDSEKNLVSEKVDALLKKLDALIQGA